jgi:hypothetical protein
MRKSACRCASCSATNSFRLSRSSSITIRLPAGVTGQGTLVAFPRQSRHMSAADRFRAAVEARDLDAAMGLFVDDVVFRSPIVHKPYQGRDVLRALLEGISQVLEDFRYERQIGTPDAADHVLVFTARVGDREVEGADFFHVNHDGLIDEMVVMLRPMTGAQAAAEGMRAHFAGAVPRPSG